MKKFLTSKPFRDQFPLFFTQTLPEMVRQALKLVEFKTIKIPILQQNLTGSVTLTRQTVACLLIHAFFCTFEHREEGSKLPVFNFITLFNALEEGYESAKFMCIINYFTRITQDPPKGNITVLRQYTHQNDIPKFHLSRKDIIDVEILLEGAIEDSSDNLQVDFANTFIGGGILCGGCVQEEIRFAISPELIISCLLCEEMNSYEAIYIVGAERFSDYLGYGSTLQFDKSCVDKTDYFDFYHDRKNLGSHLNTQIIAIDAIDYRTAGIESQYSLEYLRRDIRKAYIGFQFFTKDDTPDALDITEVHMPYMCTVDEKPIATGHWGCGAFGGNKAVKAMIQIIAASEARKNLVFYSFGDKVFTEKLRKCVRILKERKLKVSELYQMIIEFKDWKKNSKNVDLFDYLLSRSQT
uniref:poly(ADP-ribose) glycohydrolase n=2 Tax=Arcella intermedia TaxID=1963864 RepID=A0A6B2L3X2_9EUKA